MFHDKTLRRKLGRAGRAEDLTLAELQGLDIGAWFDREGAEELNDPAAGWDEEFPDRPHRNTYWDWTITWRSSATAFTTTLS